MLFLIQLIFEAQFLTFISGPVHCKQLIGNQPRTLIELEISSKVSTSSEILRLNQRWALVNEVGEYEASACCGYSIRNAYIIAGE